MTASASEQAEPFSGLRRVVIVPGDTLPLLLAILAAAPSPKLEVLFDIIGAEPANTSTSG
ncbi:hypothetical protein EST38_g7355 [Candolleomyces aberdarensis]|uniref:Uncharacterized protein n=1 Tax=Candolleomyces aberdarensis TaxID=2316362 RepID=A0A4Q2DFU2_9AGAR|nr:hypothetical protein EST38_g7355 [Candolleomyces aberdarensis]